VGGGSCEVRLTRYYRAAPDEVWAALTDPDSLARWLARPGKVELRNGGSFELQLRDGQMMNGRVRSIDPSRLLEVDWADAGEKHSIVRFELSPDGSGTVLVLDHRRVDARVGMRYMARWEHHLGRLKEVVDR
jgi:uncharacterized protein YndB with AHSA1/START domain